MQRLRKKSEETLGRAAGSATKWIGSTKSLIVHTLLFIGSFCLVLLGFSIDKILLVVTTIVSLEAIYLSIFIQMTVNNQAKHLDEVAQDVGEIQEDVDEIQEDVDEIQKDVDEIQEDVDEIQKDVDEIQEDVEDIQDEDGIDEKTNKDKQKATLTHIQILLSQLAQDVKDLKDKYK